MKRKIYMVFVFFAVMLLLAACSGTISDSASDQEESSIELNAMDTYMTLRAYGENRNGQQRKNNDRQPRPPKGEK